MICRRSGSRVTRPNLSYRTVRGNTDRRLFRLAACLCCLVVVFAGNAQPAMASAPGDGPRHTDRSAHFLLHTDLRAAEAEALLQRMEATLQATMEYWRRPVQDLIECYVVEDLQQWPHDTLPHPLARLVIERIGGVTLVNDEGVGIQARKQVVILADAKLGIAEHEVVHAYCGLVFGRTGPAWYREGIAQVFAYDQRQEVGVWCPPELLAELVDGPQKSLCNVLGPDEFNKKLFGSIAQKLDKQQKLAGLVPISDWSASDVRELDNVKKQYAWSWLSLPSALPQSQLPSTIPLARPVLSVGRREPVPRFVRLRRASVGVRIRVHTAAVRARLPC